MIIALVILGEYLARLHAHDSVIHKIADFQFQPLADLFFTNGFRAVHDYGLFQSRSRLNHIGQVESVWFVRHGREFGIHEGKTFRAQQGLHIAGDVALIHRVASVDAEIGEHKSLVLECETA